MTPEERAVVEAAVAWAIPWKEPEEAMAANGALVDAVAHYQRGLSGRAVSPDDGQAIYDAIRDGTRRKGPTYGHAPIPPDSTPEGADAARASREPGS